MKNDLSGEKYLVFYIGEIRIPQQIKQNQQIHLEITYGNYYFYY